MTWRDPEWSSLPVRPGSGKTTRFPLVEFGVDSFNADYRAAQLNAGSFRRISKEIRSQSVR